MVNSTRPADHDDERGNEVIGMGNAEASAAEWGTIPDDVCRIVVRHLNLAALVRFGSVCSAWRQVRKSPESWEEVYRTCWGDVEVLDGCQNLVQSFQKRWELLCQLPADLWFWSSCASKVKITSSTERQLNLDEASKATERALASARHSTLALAVLLNLSPSLLQGPEAVKPQQEGGMGQGGEEGREEERDSLQMRWVRHVVCNCHETRLAHSCADSCAKIARAARHAQWLVQDERLRKGWLHVLALCESSP